MHQSTILHITTCSLPLFISLYTHTHTHLPVALEVLHFDTVTSSPESCVCVWGVNLFPFMFRQVQSPVHNVRYVQYIVWDAFLVGEYCLCATTESRRSI